MISLAGKAALITGGSRGIGAAAVKLFARAGADIITIHPDACVHPHRVLQVLGSTAQRDRAGRTVARGLALNPGMPVDAPCPW